MYELTTDTEDLLIDAMQSEDQDWVRLDELVGETPGSDRAGEAARDQIDTLLKTLSAWERAAIYRCFGLESQEGVALEKDGSQIEVVRLVERALRRLREPERCQDLPAC